MSIINHSRIAMVVAKTANDGSSDRPTEEVATGYFLTGDLVLTASHVGDPSDSTFSIRADIDGPEESRWSDAEPQWVGVGDVDAMVLRTARQFGDWEMPALRAITDSGQWESTGYARASVDESTQNRKTLPLYGSYGVSRGQGPAQIALTTEQNIRDEWESYWKGISGAPIFSKEPGHDGLIGIITDADRTQSNGLVGLPAMRLLDDIRFRSVITPSFLDPLPTEPWCLVLTGESLASELFGKVENVLSGFRLEDPQFQELHERPIEIAVLDAVQSVENWAATVDALARADYLIADVTSFEPAVMLLLGIRSVVRRGVTVSVTSGELAAHSSKVPFNVQETRVLSFDDASFYDDLHGVMAEGASNLQRDSNYLDLPAYHAVRVPRPETWAEEDAKKLLVLCPFSPEYSEYYRKELQPIIRGHTGNMTPLRMMDLRSPRLVGQALYEQIRWSSRCLVDWTGWRPNVFFELGVRLACSEHDPLCIIQCSDVLEGTDKAGLQSSELSQRDLLRELLHPVEYDPKKPRQALVGSLKSWSSSIQPENGEMPSQRVLPPAATFAVSQTSFQWQRDAMLTPPHIEQRATAEQILGKDQERLPERLILFADNSRFDAALQAAVREKWIAAWLYLKYLYSAGGGPPDDNKAELITVGRLAQHALGSSRDPRHKSLRKEIQDFLRAERTRRRAREGDNGNG
jgi:hypothetical protein